MDNRLNNPKDNLRECGGGRGMMVEAEGKEPGHHELRGLYLHT